MVDVAEGLDLSELARAYAGRGSDAYQPAMLLSLLIYGYATGTHSSRKIERATYDSLALRFIARDQHPDHDTLASFRRRFGEQFAEVFVQVLRVARENQLSRLGTVSVDGTKIHASASRHSALACGPAEKIEAQLKAEVQAMRGLAETADQGTVPEGVDLPEGSSGKQIGWPPSRAPRPRLKRAPGSASSASRPSTRRRWPHAKPKRRQPARTPGAKRRRPRRRGHGRTIR